MASTTTTDEIKARFKFNSDNRLQELKAFDETKAGVKGLVDQGILKIPTLFHHPPHNFSKATNSTNTQYTIPASFKCSPALSWRDTFKCQLAPNAPKPEDLHAGLDGTSALQHFKL
ncbi:1-aminocyclopropane-1-carboxylate oxidase protein [Trifolium repens]|nr:1-aminocyclopropane-1-carboxylate oxidase protein [Trifolium repens]